MCIGSVGELIIVPPAETYETASKRAESAEDGVDCADWFYCAKELSEQQGGARPYAGAMLFAFSVAPTSSESDDASVSEAVAEAIRIVRESGLPNETTSMFTTIEGEWDQVMPVIKQACEAVARFSPRVSLVLKADLRPGFEDQLTHKVEQVDRLLTDTSGN